LEARNETQIAASAERSENLLGFAVRANRCIEICPWKRRALPRLSANEVLTVRKSVHALDIADGTTNRSSQPAAIAPPWCCVASASTKSIADPARTSQTIMW
jgi:hypothetical protein